MSEEEIKLPVTFEGEVIDYVFADPHAYVYFVFPVAVLAGLSKPGKGGKKGTRVRLEVLPP